MVNLKTFANRIKVNLPLEDDTLRLLLRKIAERFNEFKQNEMEKSPIIKSDDFNQRCQALLVSKIVEIKMDSQRSIKKNNKVMPSKTKWLEIPLPLQCLLAALLRELGGARLRLAELRVQLSALRAQPLQVLRLKLARALLGHALLLARQHLLDQRILRLLLFELLRQLRGRVLQLLHDLEAPRLLRRAQACGT